MHLKTMGFLRNKFLKKTNKSNKERIILLPSFYPSFLPFFFVFFFLLFTLCVCLSILLGWGTGLEVRKHAGFKDCDVVMLVLDEEMNQATYL